MSGATTWTSQHRATIRTLQALLAGGLGVLPLTELFQGSGWLIDAWLTMLIVIGPAALLRLTSPPRVSHVWLGLVLGVFWLTARFVPTHALLGFIPGPGAWHDVSHQLSLLHDTINNGVAPVPATEAVRLPVCALVGLFAALIDLVGVLARRGALAGVPLLVVYTVSGAVPRHPVGWLLFIGAAVGFLLLLGLDASDEVTGWGRLMPRPGSGRSRAVLGVSGQRIAIAAVAAAVLLPLIAPGKPTNVIANAFHNGTTGSVSGLGGISLDPLATLKGDLTQPKATPLFTVQLANGSIPAQPPFYLRAGVLTTYTPKGWVLGPADASDLTPVGDGEQITPATAGEQFQARITIAALGGSPPVFAQPITVSGLGPSTQWNRDQLLLTDTTVSRGQQYEESVSQPNPSTTDLENANLPADLPTDLQVPAAMPAQVVTLVNRLTAGKTTPYDKALALFEYFTNAANGFYYTLNATAGHSGSDLVDFLTNKGGFCQQYAAALGIMLRMAGVPARVVLGYTHPALSLTNSFTVTTADAHAWDEAYFEGVGWVPFDATPLAGIDGGATADLPWAPHPTAAANSVGPARASDTLSHSASGSAAATTPTGTTTAGSRAATTVDLWPLLWAALIVLAVVALVLAPAWVRWRRRWHRLHAGRSGDADQLWTELSATAVDLGYVWSPARSPRQAAHWLGRDVVGVAEPLTALAGAVEAARYARGGPGGGSADGAALVSELERVEAGLRANRGSRSRLRSRLFPASLGWRLLPGPRRR